MSAAEVIREMQSQGVVLYLVGGKIKVRGDERIVSSYRSFITKHRGAVLDYLAGGLPPPPRGHGSRNVAPTEKARKRGFVPGGCGRSV